LLNVISLCYIDNLWVQKIFCNVHDLSNLFIWDKIMKKISSALTVTGTICAIGISGLTVSGCAPRIGASNVSVQGVGEMSETLRGVIIAARPVTISASRQDMDNQPGAGAALGAVGGGVLGSQIGQGSGSVLAALGGAALGGVAGHMIGQKITDQEGMEYQIQLERGGIVTMRQGADPILRVGQRVMVINSSKDVLNHGGGNSRVIPDNS
jgi:outer membrane lipoprotein SlyB